MHKFFNFDREPDFESGEILLIDKPKDWSSFDIVKKIRNLLSTYLGKDKIKVGHAGTLDPLATGLLIICTGKATKLIESIQEGEKEYEAVFRLGAITPSYDMETEISEEFDYSCITEEMIINTAKSMEGISFQTPPIYSAIQINGKRAYEYARKGKEIKLDKREINIPNINIQKILIPYVNLIITCSKGTYVRSLANDFGKKLDNGAFLYYLRRLKSGNYSIDNAIEMKNFEEFLNKM
ncbi:MAG: tRNA pseudouridine(55) synthase TruB [Bacteroidales bacterium]|jgi:tRNA pseudouridine55 synthase|nr:tRNA pseudouridine(55) synthase TruB [Bacteroidales bacterium]